MQIDDYIWCCSESANGLTKQVRNLLDEGYEPYGPPMFGAVALTSGATNDNGYNKGGNGYTSSEESLTFSQVMIKPLKVKEEPKKLAFIPLSQNIGGSQSCADCSCEPNETGEARRSCGRLG